MQFIVLAFAAFVAAAPQFPGFPGSGSRGFGLDRYQCDGGRQAQCCQVNVLDLASLSCNPPPRDPRDRDDFAQMCTEAGATANCCTLSTLNAGVLCQEVTPSKGF